MHMRSYGCELTPTVATFADQKGFSMLAVKPARGVRPWRTPEPVVYEHDAELRDEGERRSASHFRSPLFAPRDTDIGPTFRFAGPTPVRYRFLRTVA